MADLAVVIPTKDRVDLLAVAVRSATAQRGVDVEVIVVDDGSSAAAAARIAQLAGDRVRIVRRTTSGGVGSARNAGIAAATAEWVGFLDDDDVWAPDKGAHQLGAVQVAGRAWGYSGAVKFVEGPVLWQRMPAPSVGDVVDRLPWKNVVPAGASNVVAQREAVTRLGGFDVRLQHLADWDLWLRLLAAEGPPAACASFDVGYRVHGTSMSLSPSGILDDLAVIDARHRPLRDGAPLNPAATHLWIAQSWMRAGRRTKAAASFAAALRHGERAGLRGIARALVPVRPSPPHAARGSGRARWRRAARGEPAGWPEGTEAWLRAALHDG